MTAELASSAAAPARRWAAAPLLAAFAVAVALRVVVGGVAVARSTPAGLAFAGALAAAALAAGPRTRVDRRTVAAGLAGAALLLTPVALAVLPGGAAARPAGAFAAWAAVVAVVAAAEEAFLRGALYDAVEATWGSSAAILVGAAAFAALHVPLYGWGSVPLDAAAGLVLGVLRKSAGTWTAPAIAHVVADLGGWWLG